MDDVKHCPNPECPHRDSCRTAAEYRVEIEVCADCGTTLAFGPAGEPEPSQTEPRPAGDQETVFETVAILRDHSSVQRCMGLLEEAGIPHICVGEHAASIFGGAALDVRIRVPAEELERARSLIVEVTSGTIEPEREDHDEPEDEHDHALSSSDRRVAELTARETRRLGMRPLWFFLLLLLLLGLKAVLD